MARVGVCIGMHVCVFACTCVCDGECTCIGMRVGIHVVHCSVHGQCLVHEWSCIVISIHY